MHGGCWGIAVYMLISTWNDWTKAIIDHAFGYTVHTSSFKAMRDIPKEASAAVDDIRGVI